MSVSQGGHFVDRVDPLFHRAAGTGDVLIEHNRQYAHQ